jgi:hypothetical protein
LNRSENLPNTILFLLAELHLTVDMRPYHTIAALSKLDLTTPAHAGPYFYWRHCVCSSGVTFLLAASFFLPNETESFVNDTVILLIREKE